MMKIESKEKLAKLLATEDLDVQHQQVETAYFDVKSRTLVLPTWKDMPNHLYDLLVGHEVGHALFTPTSEQRLKKAYKKTSKACINILEDARIEKLVKKRYPGLRKQFFSGYSHLVDNDFFGLSKRPISDMNILDKINLYFKIPTSVDIEFNDIEQSFIEKIEATKSFKDIEAIAVEIYDYAKKQKKEEQDQEAGDDSEANPSKYFEQESLDGDTQESFETEANDDNEEDMEQSADSESSTDDESDSDEEGDSNSGHFEEDEEENSYNKYMEDDKEDNEEIDSLEEEIEKSDSKSKDEVRSTTYEHFQERLNTLIDHKITNVYLTVPSKGNLKDAVHDYKDVHGNLNKFYSSGKDKEWQYYDTVRFEAIKKSIYERANKTLSQWKKESVKTVNHIAMEFERKKAADVYKKVLITKTGVLDTNKLFSAKYNDDVFKKNVRLPEGKNHGLVMIMDWSGSMADNIYGCIKQVIELSFFCKKVNIPFEVFSFTDGADEQSYDEATGKTIYAPVSFEYKTGDVVIDPRVRLRNYLSSRMNAKDYNNGLLNLCILANRFKRQNYYDRYAHYPCPKADELRCTPLNGAILLAEHVIRKFKKDNNLQNVNAVFLTDGEASGSLHRYDATKESVEGRLHNRTSLYVEHRNIYIKDSKTKKNHLIIKSGQGRGRGVTPALLDIVKDRLGINIVGFFILNTFSTNTLWRYVPRNTQTDGYNETRQFFTDWCRKVKKAGYFIKDESGYDEYYVIKGDGLNSTATDDLNVNPNMTAHRMAQNFMKKNNSFKTNRIILTRFIDLITENTTV